ncbi:hypothetical protein [Nocardia niwae]|uniref:Acyl-CoA dehydrogenase n=1 Tax=Nocardia niwae TaxID=626084 RepID=A0ABV2XE92_9NOCA|nr:hypothetical protein [Nocardia niwae]
MSCPSLVLPLTSVLPEPAADFGRPRNPALSPVTARLRALTQRLRDEMPTPSAVSAALAAAAAELAALIPAGVPVVAQVETTSEVEGSIDYDRYFGFVRVAELPRDVLAAQIVITCAAVLAEMSTAPIALDESISALDAIGAMLAWCATTSVTVRETVSRVAGRPFADAAVEVRAEYRWIIGHHLFNLSTVFCLAEIQRAQASAVAGDDSATADALLAAARYLRATTAAMWFAGAFPAEIYLRHVRPSMAVLSGRETGFSGTQNLDYHRLRRAIDVLRVALAATPVRGSAVLRSAHAVFTEIEIQDVEHHILIAAAKVGGTEPSLLSHANRTELPGHMDLVPAVEVLRDLAEQRRASREYGA